MNKVLASKTNRVEKLMDEKRASVIRKTYLDHAIATGVRVPAKRILIERRVAASLASMLTSTTRQVQVFASVAHTRDTNTFPYVEGQCLRLLAISDWPKPRVFYRLGSLLRQIEHTFKPRTFMGLQTTSRQLGQIIRRYKTGSMARRSGDYFSLGDLSLANMIASRGALILIDFEFAHSSSAAFDIGMLIAELDYRTAPVARLRCARQALLRGYIAAGGRASDVMAWRGRRAKRQMKSRSTGICSK